MKDKKLLIIGGGRSIHTFNLILLIKDYFSDVLLITDFMNDDYADIKQVKAEFSFSNPLNLIRLTLKIRKTIKAYRPDFIILNQVDTASFCALLANNTIPNLVVALGSDVLLTPNKGKLYMFLTKYILRNGKYFTTGARYAAKVMNELAGKDLDVMVANTGFEPEVFPSEKQNIVYSNRLHKPLYRISSIVEAFSRFIENPERRDWKLVIGATGDEDNLRNIARRLNIEDKVEFIGWVNKEINNHYYCISKIWVSIPESDNTPISLMEAMAAGCIPVMSDLIANKEWVEDGVNGVIASDLDTNYIERALDLDYNRLVEFNTSLMQREGTKDANRRKFYSIFDKEFNNEL